MAKVRDRRSDCSQVVLRLGVDVMLLVKLLLLSADSVLAISIKGRQNGASLKLVAKLLTYTMHEPLLIYCSGLRSLFVVSLQSSWDACCIRLLSTPPPDPHPLWPLDTTPSHAETLVVACRFYIQRMHTCQHPVLAVMPV